MRIALALAVGCFTSLAAVADSGAIRAHLLSRGIYALDINGKIADHNLAGGVRNSVTRRSNSEHTTIVPAQLCISFGFEYIIVSATKDAALPIRMITRLPAAGLRNPETGITTRVQEVVLTRAVGQRHFRSYTLEHAWEAVPGEWTFELWRHNQKLLEQRFTLVAPCDGGCGTPDSSLIPCPPNSAKSPKTS